MAARDIPPVNCTHCGHVMYARPVQHDAAVMYRCPRCHITVRVPSSLTLTAGPFMTKATA